MKIIRKLTRDGWSRTHFKTLLKTKGLLVLLFLTANLLFLPLGNSQNTSISIQQENKSIRDILAVIETQNNYRFFYNEALINVEQKVSINATNKTINEILDELFKSTDISYELKGNLIILSNQLDKKDETKQSIVTVKGKVIDNNGVTIPGVTIIIKGSTKGATTDMDGTYILEDVAATDVLVFSFIGMLQKEIQVGERSSYTIDVVLEESVIGLEEFVVVGYGSTKSKDLTGSISSVKVDELGHQPLANVGDAIQGRAAGVQVFTSGSPGSSPVFRIRGTGTIGNNDPLIVIDGMPLNGPLNQVNMDDIASLQVLKDASSTAIYGSRGANGVIIITTKRGEKDKSTLSFKGFSGISNTTGMTDVLNAAQFAQLHNEMLTNGGEYTNPAFSNPAFLGEGTNWVDAFFGPGYKKSGTISYSAGNDKSNIYTSLNIFDEKGIILSTTYQRFIFQLNSDSKISDKLKFGNSLKLNHDFKNNGETSIQGALTSLPTQPIYDEFGNFTGPEGQPLYSGDISNPIGKATVVEGSTRGYNVQGNIYGELTILKDFKFKTLLGLEANFWKSRTWTPPYQWGAHQQIDAYLGESSNQSITTLWDNTLTYDKEIYNGLNLTGVIGTSAQENKFEYISGSIQNFASNQTQTLNNGIDQAVLNGSANEWAIFSYFARTNFNYLSKYYVTATVRRDGSSRFGEGNKYGTFPSGSIAWRISNEDFFKSGLIDDLKIRAGYGLTGNQEIGNYSFASSFNTYVYNFDGNFVSAVIPTVLPNTNVKWESQEQFNIGIDAFLLNDRINIILDAYVKNTKDMLVPQSVPVTSGYSDIYVPYVNAGEIQNKGIEAIISSRNIEKDNFSWSSDLVFSINRNTVVDINSDVPMTSGSIGLNYTLARIQNGYPINVFYGFVTDGIFQTQEEVYNHAMQVPGTSPSNSTSPGDIRFQDLNSDGIINDYDRTFIGNPNPDFLFSFNNTVDYRRFSLIVFLQGVYGNDIFNANRFVSEAMNITSNQSTAVLNRWTGEGTSNTMPRAVYGDPNYNTRVSSRYIEDGSYLRLKNVTLSYAIPDKLFGKEFFDNASVYLSGQNLFTITNYNGFDPEVSSSGIDNSTYPVSRTISVGINVGF